MASRNRTAGHNWEREVIQDFKDIGFTNAVSTRYGSKLLDDSGIDIMNVGTFSVQCKNEARKIDYPKVLDHIQAVDTIKVICHKLTKKSPKGKFVTQGKYVILSYDSFIKILENSEYSPKHKSYIK